MEIPNEVIEAAHGAVMASSAFNPLALGDSHDAMVAVRMAAPAIAEWARKEAFEEVAESDPTAWIQFKGTDICMDIQCECGVQTHFDGYFAYAIECGSCGRKYDVQQEISLRPFSDRYTPQPTSIGDSE